MKLIFLLIASACTSACMADETKPKPAPSPAARLSSESGRYIFGQISEYRRDQYMLDTKTGRLWQVVVTQRKDENGKPIPNSEENVLQPISFQGIDGAYRDSPTPEPFSK